MGGEFSGKGLQDCKKGIYILSGKNREYNNHLVLCTSIAFNLYTTLYVGITFYFYSTLCASTGSTSVLYASTGIILNLYCTLVASIILH